MRRPVCWLLMLSLAAPLAAQESAVVRDARSALDELDFGRSVTLARQALAGTLTAPDQVLAWETLGLAYASLDSSDRAVEAFSQMVLLAPERDIDPVRYPPRIVNLHAQAVGQVLVIRRLHSDSTAFVAGRGAATITFEVSRPARVVARIVGQGLNLPVDSLLADRAVTIRWEAVVDGTPMLPGAYQLLVSASEGRNQFQALLPLELRHGTLDTADHITSLPGRSELPEFETPPRDWRPLGLAVLYAGLGAGAALGLQNSALGGVRRELVGVSLLTVASGLTLSLRRPEPRPVESARLFNQFLRDVIADRNRQIADQNAALRRQVLLVVRPTGAAR